jgi:hypothetical protein
LTTVLTVGGLGVEDEHLELCDVPLIPLVISSCVIGPKKTSTHKNKDISVVVLLDTVGNSIDSESRRLKKFTQNTVICVDILHHVTVYWL